MIVSLPDLVSAHVVGFLLVLCRVSGLFLLAPVFSSRMLPARIRLTMAIAITLAIMPIATHGQPIPAATGTVVLMSMKELAAGLLFAFPMAVVMAGVEAGSGLLDTIVGFSFAAVLDPVNNQQTAILGQFYGLFALMVFLLGGGDHVMIGGLAASYRTLPIGHTPALGAVAANALDVFAQVFAIGLEMAAPALVALVITDAALGLVSRAVPQMNVFVVGLPAKLLVGFGVIAASLPFLNSQLQTQLTQSVAQAMQLLHP